jgi:SpoVK/Ycf46/Vps4 family AAA+-type ATPase
LVFSGNPETGKTTVARILGKIYRRRGILSKGHLVETDRSDPLAGYVGQTAIQTKESVEKAKGGILFIDEAYSITPPERRYRLWTRSDRHTFKGYGRLPS